MSKASNKLTLFKAYQEALNSFLKTNLNELSFKQVDYVSDLNERVLVAIDFLEKLVEIEKRTEKIEKEIINNENK